MKRCHSFLVATPFILNVQIPQLKKGELGAFQHVQLVAVRAHRSTEARKWLTGCSARCPVCQVPFGLRRTPRAGLDMG